MTMYYRVDNSLNPLDYRNTTDLEELANAAGVRCHWARARCQHGYTRQQFCIDCEGGYVTDSHYFMRVRSVPLMALADDEGEWIAYIPKREQPKLRKLIPDLDKKVNEARTYNYGGNYFPARST